MHRHIYNLIWIILLLCLTGCGFTKGKVETSHSEYDITTSEFDTQLVATVSKEQVAVYVCGAVTNPGVFYLPTGSIKLDALEAAGGLADGAHSTYVNLAQEIKNGEQIYFPYEYEVQQGILSSEQEQESQLVNINTATKDELMTIPGIGESKADAIISYREQYGPFASIEDITNIAGIKEGVYNKIKDYIIVD